MRPSIFLVLAGTVLASAASAQDFSAGDWKVVESARAKYYNLEATGFVSLTCSVKFDPSTVPLVPMTIDDGTRKLLEATGYTVVIKSRSAPVVSHQFPADAKDSAVQQASQTANLLTSLVDGLFQTWQTNGLRGPIPPFNSWVKSFASNDKGYTLSLRAPGAPIQILMDKNYLVTEIISMNGKIDERPSYTPTPDGLLLSGNEAIDETQEERRVEVKYELESSVVDGLRVPSSVHLQVKPNIDVKFALTECAVTKGTVVSVSPPDASPN